MKRVYTAGAYSSSNVTGVMDNMRRGLKLSAACLKAGFAVYSPWCDCLLHFHEEMPLEQCYAYSEAWLRVSEAVLLVPGWEQSNGVQNELKVAEKLGIPVFNTLESLCQWRDQQCGKKAVEHGWE